MNNRHEIVEEMETTLRTFNHEALEEMTRWALKDSAKNFEGDDIETHRNEIYAIQTKISEGEYSNKENWDAIAETARNSVTCNADIIDELKRASETVMEAINAYYDVQDSQNWGRDTTAAMVTLPAVKTKIAA